MIREVWRFQTLVVVQANLRFLVRISTVLHCPCITDYFWTSPVCQTSSNAFFFNLVSVLLYGTKST